MKHWIMNIYHSKCPCCGSTLRWIADGELDVNVYSHNPINVPGFFQLDRACKNPLCEWSKISKEDDDA